MKFNIQIFRITYCLPYEHAQYQENKMTCQAFVSSVQANQPEMMNKAKVHLLLHLADNMLEFGPTSAYSTER